MTKLNGAWQTIFDEVEVLKKLEGVNFLDIKAEEIKKIGKIEPRLATKFDFIQSRPKCFSDNHLSILAINNGVYRIGKFHPYFSIPDMQGPAIELKAPVFLKSLDPLNISSESQALDIFLASGGPSFLKKDDLTLTIRGRRYLDKIFFKKDGIEFPVNGVQVEVDGGYEGKDNLWLMEAKMGLESNMNIRQILYPYLMWDTKLQGHKSVRNIILFYEEPFFHWFEVQFGNFLNNLEVKIISQNKYRFIETIPKEKIGSLKKGDLEIFKEVPFPQADSLPRAIDILRQIYNAESLLSKEDLFEINSIDERQIDYYINALFWLQFIQPYKGKSFKITKEGELILKGNLNDRRQIIKKRIEKDPIFNYFIQRKSIDLDDKLKKLFNEYNVKSPVTMQRRLMTVTSWINYLAN